MVTRIMGKKGTLLLFDPSPVDKFRLGSLPESWRLGDLGVWISQDIITINKHANHDS